MSTFVIWELLVSSVGLSVLSCCCRPLARIWSFSCDEQKAGILDLSGPRQAGFHKPSRCLMNWPEVENFCQNPAVYRRHLACTAAQPACTINKCSQMAIPIPFVAKWPFLFLLWLGGHSYSWLPHYYCIPNQTGYRVGEGLVSKCWGIFESKNAACRS